MLQKQDRRLTNLEFAYKSSEVLRNRTVLGLLEIPALLLCQDDSKENHCDTGAPEVSGMIPHTNPLLCGVGATAQTLVVQFHPHRTETLQISRFVKSGSIFTFCVPLRIAIFTA